MAKKNRSIEEQIEDYAKSLFKKNNTKFFTKTESINQEIEDALKNALSKSGGNGGNAPDIKLFVESASLERFPVMIEVKGKVGDFIKRDNINNKKKDGSIDYKVISKYAVNGAIHYSNAIIEQTVSYKNVIAVGINGYDDINERKYEVEIYFISKDNYCVPKLLSDDISLLFKKNWDKLIQLIHESTLTDDEREKLAKESETLIETNLKTLNQLMQDDLNISVGSRVELVTGMIMAGLGVAGKVAPLDVTDLKGQLGTKTHDGSVFINKISDFLTEKELPEDKRNLIVNDLQRVFLNRGLYEPINGESKLRTLYAHVQNDVIPYIDPEKSTYLDFTGKLFNVLTDWVDIPDGGKNDVVLTPRYVTDLMAKLCMVNRNSYVWDLAAGTAGFLVSSMKLMLKDADNIKNIDEREAKKASIRGAQILGVEKRPDIYLLAVLNMILMGDGSSNILQADSLKEFDGKYAQGINKGKDYPANVFLLNPPYSAEGKGFVFVKKALSKMTHGKAAILIQENAGSGAGLPYTKEILENNTLIASIHMADIFKGKAGVQTAIYVIDIGIPHDQGKEVVFIDMSDDGYTRQNKKKATSATNLKNSGDANGRYEEIIDIVLGRKKKTDYFKEGIQVIRDTVSLEGNDWMFIQHKRIDTMPTEADFMRVVSNYLAWKADAVLKGDAVDG